MKHHDMHSTRNMKIWWSKFTSKKGKTKKLESTQENFSRTLDVNEEYKEVFRTKSYAEIWTKVQDQLTRSSSSTTATTITDSIIDNNKFSSSSSTSSTSIISPTNNSFNSPSKNSSPLPYYTHLSESLLEPCQEVVDNITKSSKLGKLLLGYFDASLEACNICELLLRGIHKTRSHHKVIKRVIKLSRIEDGLNNFDNEAKDPCRDIVIKDLASFARLNNPLSTIINGAVDFPKIHEKNALLLRKLISRRRKIRRRAKFTSFYKKTASYGFVITYAVLAIAMLALAMHSVVGLLAAPGFFVTISSNVIKKKSDTGLFKERFLRSLASQLDDAAKGIYILINDFDTVAILVKRLHDEMEHMKALAQMCVRNRRSNEVVKEALREIAAHESGFMEQLNELEEHIYLCFLTINRSRRSVIQQIFST